jgi:hypothetical protein
MGETDSGFISPEVTVNMAPGYLNLFVSLLVFLALSLIPAGWKILFW